MLRKSKVAFIEPLLASAMVLERRIDACIREQTAYGLSQFKILVSIRRSAGTKNQGDCSQAAVAHVWGVSEAAISRQIALLAEDKLITRHFDPNEKRRVMLGLTAKGKTFLSKTMRSVDKELGRMFRPMSRTAKNQLAAHLRKVLDILSTDTGRLKN